MGFGIKEELLDALEDGFESGLGSLSAPYAPQPGCVFVNGLDASHADRFATSCDDDSPTTIPVVQEENVNFQIFLALIVVGITAALCLYKYLKSAPVENSGLSPKSFSVRRPHSVLAMLANVKVAEDVVIASPGSPCISPAFVSG